MSIDLSLYVRIHLKITRAVLHAHFTRVSGYNPDACCVKYYSKLAAGVGVNALKCDNPVLRPKTSKNTLVNRVL